MPTLSYFSLYPTAIYTRPSYSQNPIVTASGKVQNYQMLTTSILTKFKIKDAILGNAAMLYPYQWKDGDRPDLLALQYYGSDSFFWVVFYSNGAFDLDYDFPMTADELNAYLELKYRSPVMDANGYGYVLSTTLNANISVGAGSFTVGSTTQMPLPGQPLQFSDASETVSVMYTSGNTIYLNNPVVNAHTSGATVSWENLNGWLNLDTMTRYKLTVNYLLALINTYTVSFTDNPSIVFNIDLNSYNYYSGSGYSTYVAQAESLGVNLPSAIVGSISQWQYEYNLNEAKRSIVLLDNQYLQQIVTEFTTNMNNISSLQKQIGDI